MIRVGDSVYGKQATGSRGGDGGDEEVPDASSGGNALDPIEELVCLLLDRESLLSRLRDIEEGSCRATAYLLAPGSNVGLAQARLDQLLARRREAMGLLRANERLSLDLLIHSDLSAS